MDLFTHDKEVSWETLGGGVSRKVMSHSPDLMIVKVRFEAGSIGSLHQHPHTQISYVEAGRFEYTIGDQMVVMASGDSCLIPPDALHGCLCLEEGVLIDSFTPVREDFLPIQTLPSDSR